MTMAMTKTKRSVRTCCGYAKWPVPWPAGKWLRVEINVLKKTLTRARAHTHWRTKTTAVSVFSLSNRDHGTGTENALHRCLLQLKEVLQNKLYIQWVNQSCDVHKFHDCFVHCGLVPRGNWKILKMKNTIEHQMSFALCHWQNEMHTHLCTFQVNDWK